MLIYYAILTIGILLVISSVFIIVAMYIDKDYTILNIGKSLVALLIGVLCFVITLPSLKYVVLKEYDVVRGKCVIEIDSSGRAPEADFKMINKDEMFTFRDIPALDAYGKSIPYYCEVTVTKDHQFGVSYKIYDNKTRKLILTGK